jgi:hypothetical protein
MAHGNETPSFVLIADEEFRPTDSAGNNDAVRCAASFLGGGRRRSSFEPRRRLFTPQCESTKTGGGISMVLDPGLVALAKPSGWQSMPPGSAAESLRLE